MSSSESISSDFKTTPITDHHEGSVPVKTCTITGDGDEFIVIGNHKYYRHELMQAFGGTLNPGLAPYPTHKYGNTAPLGLIATSFNILVLGLYFAGAKHIQFTNVAVSLFIFMGGLVQFLSGIWGFFIGSQVGTFIFITFTSYGSFWLSFGAIFIPAFGIADAYKDVPDGLNQAIGLMAVGWAIFTTMLLMTVVKSTFSFFWALFTLDLTIIVLAAGFLSGSENTIKAGGIIGVINAFSGWYEAWAGMSNPQNNYIVPRDIPLPDFAKLFRRKK